MRDAEGRPVGADRFGSEGAALAAFAAARVTSGFSTLLAAQPTKWWAGEAELVIPLRAELLQHHGYAHGAVVGAAADNACAWAAASLAGDVVTSSYTLQLLAPAKGARLRAKGKSSARASGRFPPRPKCSPRAMTARRPNWWRLRSR